MANHKGTAHMDALYGHLWLAAKGEGPYAMLDESLNPRPTSETMYSLVTGLGVGPDESVLDAGRGNSNHSFGLAQRSGCAVAGLDPAETGLEMGRTAVEQEHLAKRVSFQPGLLETLPYLGEAFDLIWCRAALAVYWWVMSLALGKLGARLYLLHKTQTR